MGLKSQPERSTVGTNQASHRAIDTISVPPITLFFAATGGGVQKTQVLIANGLARRGVGVDIVMPEARGPYLEQLRPDVRLVDLRTRRPIGVVRGLTRQLSKGGHRALIVSQQHTAIAALLARQLLGHYVPMAIIQHNNLTGVCHASRRLDVRFALPLLARLFYRRADRLCAVSDGVAVDLAAVTGLSRERVDLLQNPIFAEDMLAQARLPSGHPWLDDKREPVVLGAGNLIKNKDFPTLLRAFAQVRQHRAARLVIIGEGEARANLLALVAHLGITDSVDFPGFTANPYAFMARADVFALSSRVEGFGNVLVEAMACGCPVVSTDCPSGPSEILLGGRLGHLVQMEDDRDLAQAILTTMRSPVDVAALKARAADFSVDRAVDGYARLATDLVSRTGL